METPKVMPPEMRVEFLKDLQIINERFAEMEVGFREMSEGLDKLAEEVFAKIEPEKRPNCPKGLWKY